MNSSMEEKIRFVRFACRTFLATMFIQFSYSCFGSAHMLQGPTYLSFMVGNKAQAESSHRSYIKGTWEIEIQP